MNREGKKPDLHLIDGKKMTVDQIAEMLGATVRALQCRRCRMGGVSYQVIVDMYRTNQIGGTHDKWHRHLVDGEWITIEEGARRVGVTASAIRTWRFNHRDAQGNKPTLAEAMAHYRQYQTGELKRHPGSVAQAHWVNGRMLTIAQAAEKYGTTENGPADLPIPTQMHPQQRHPGAGGAAEEAGGEGDHGRHHGGT